MKNTGHPSPRRGAFTLIELLVVISIIGVLAALIFPMVASVNRNKQFKTAEAELKAVEVAIDGYKTKLGFYPPDNPTNSAVNPLYFELMGTTNRVVAGKPDLWVTLDGTGQIGTSTTPTIQGVFGVDGFANSSTRAKSDDNGATAVSFISNLKPNQTGLIDPANQYVKILVCTVQWPPGLPKSPIPTNPTLNPFQYNSSHPTNNTASYDLWVDIVIGTKTNRICNWSTQPIKL